MRISPILSYHQVRCTLAVVLALLLTSCGIFDAKTHAHKPARQTHKPSAVKPDEFVQHLSLARLAFEDGADNKEITLHIHSLQAYQSQQVRKKTGKPKPASTQPIILLECEREGAQGKQQFMAPFIRPHTTPEFPALSDLVKRLGEKPYTLHDIKILNTVIVPGEIPKKLPDLSAEAQKEALDRLYRGLLARSLSLTQVEQAEIYVQLVQFFMEQRVRDGAYLALENAKQALAEATPKDSPNQLAHINDLTHQLEGLEHRLHKEMPFSL